MTYPFTDPESYGEAPELPDFPLTSDDVAAELWARTMEQP